MKRESMRAGVLFGTLMGGYFTAQTFLDGRPLATSLGLGVLAALAGGLLFGVLMHLFATSRMVQRQTAVTPDELFKGESILRSMPANLAVRLQDFGLGKAAYRDMLFLAGMKEVEAVGGTLHLTNFRLLFRSHPVNRLNGTVSIYLSTIRDVRDSSRWLVRKISIGTTIGSVDLVVSEPSRVAVEMTRARDAITEAQAESLRQQIEATPAVGGLRPIRVAETINGALRVVNSGQEIIEAAAAPIATLASMFASELIERIVERSGRPKPKTGNKA